MIEWLNQNASAVGAMASVINVLLIFVLVGATIYYAKATSKISEDTKRQAEASVRMAREMERSRELSYHPELVLHRVPVAIRTNEFILMEVQNVGNGSATEVIVERWWKGSYYLEDNGSPLPGRDHRGFKCILQSDTPEPPQTETSVKEGDVIVRLSARDLAGKPTEARVRKISTGQMKDQETQIDQNVIEGDVFWA